MNNIAASIKVRVGSSEHSRGGDLLSVIEIFQNEKFNPATVDYDFSLLKLEKPLEFDENKKAIKLQNYDEIFADETQCVISGWGNTQNVTESNMELRSGLSFKEKLVLEPLNLCLMKMNFRDI